MAGSSKASGVLGGLGSLGSSADLYRMPNARYGRQEEQPATQPQQNQAPTNTAAPSQNIFHQILNMVLNRRPWWNDPASPDIFRQTPSNPPGNDMPSQGGLTGMMKRY